MFVMHITMEGLWQLSPLTDVSLPQDDLTFPAPLSQALPATLSESEIASQEWHLMHDIELDDAMLSFPCAELQIGGVDHYAEVRVNGVAVLDCDGSQPLYRKDVRPYLQPGRNRIEILFLHPDEDELLEWDEALVDTPPTALELLTERVNDPRIGVWQVPVLQFIRHARIEQVKTEQIWHHGGGCELKVDLDYQPFQPSLLSAAVKFDAMTYRLPLDMRSHHTSVLFQVEAPKTSELANPDCCEAYVLQVELDGQVQRYRLKLNPQLCSSHS